MSRLVDIKAGRVPDHFILELTQRCNNSCLYCYTAWGAPRLNYSRHCQGEMSTTEVKEVIAKLQDEVGLKTVGLSGGEPLMREDVPELLAFIRSRGIAPYLISNATRLTGEIARAIADTRSACEITLLSYRRETHDRLAGRRGARDQAIQGITNLAVAGAHPAVVFVATRLNFMDLYRTAELAVTLGAAALSYNRINIGAHNLKFADRLLPTPSMIAENMDMLESLSQKYGVPIAAAVVIEPCVVDVRKYKDINFGWCPLGSETAYFTIDPAGNVRICNHSPVILGNIRSQNFLDIYFQHPYLQAFRETWPVECQDCNPALKKICRGGCKAAAEQCFGTLEHVDPFVTISKGIEWGG